MENDQLKRQARTTDRGGAKLGGSHFGTDSELELQVENKQLKKNIQDLKDEMDYMHA